jgi:hypothetical protein
VVLLRLPDHTLKFLMLVDGIPVYISQRVDRLLRASGKIDHFDVRYQLPSLQIHDWLEDVSEENSLVKNSSLTNDSSLI